LSALVAKMRASFGFIPLATSFLTVAAMSSPSSLDELLPELELLLPPDEPELLSPPE
jgi:hypothetical protein